VQRVVCVATLTPTVSSAAARIDCSGASHHTATTSRRSRALQRPAGNTTTTSTTPIEGGSIYAHTGAGDLSPAVNGVPSRVYVPNSESNTVDVIDPTTFQVVGHFAVGRVPQHVAPAWDLRTLYVDNDRGNSL